MERIVVFDLAVVVHVPDNATEEEIESAALACLVARAREADGGDVVDILNSEMNSVASWLGGAAD